MNRSFAVSVSGTVESELWVVEPKVIVPLAISDPVVEESLAPTE